MNPNNKDILSNMIGKKFLYQNINYKFINFKNIEYINFILLENININKTIWIQILDSDIQNFSEEILFLEN